MHWFRFSWAIALDDRATAHKKIDQAFDRLVAAAVKILGNN